MTLLPTRMVTMTTFFRAIHNVPPVRIATRDAAGSLPIRAQRHCDAAAIASSFGWYVYPPICFSLERHHTGIACHLDGYGKAFMIPPTGAIQFPHHATVFNEAAPRPLQGRSMPFLTGLPELGMLQIWTGYFVRTCPETSLLIRPPANVCGEEPPIHFTYEGIIETDHYFSPIFTNVRLPKSGKVSFSIDRPIVQVQPLSRRTYASTATSYNEIDKLSDWTAAEWRDYETVVSRQEGFAAYAVAARRRRRNEN
jgi:hypothetical protein